MKKLFFLTFLLVGIVMLNAVSGPKIRIAIADFEDKSGSYGHWEVGRGMSDMLITALVESGRFTVIEREQMDKIIGEQKFSLTGMVTQQTSAKLGKMLGVPYLITGSITEFINKASSGGTGIKIRGIRVSGKKFYGKVGIDVRIYDVSTGEIIVAKHTEGENKGVGFNLGASQNGIDFRNSKIKKSPIGKAARKAIEEAVKAITEALSDRKWIGKIITVKEGMVYINGGENYGIKEGDTFTVESVGDELIDPDTGLSLGSETEEIGKIKVVQVKEKYAICEVVSGKGFTKGQLIKVEDEE